MISGRDVIIISSIEWDFLWQAHQEIASRLAAAGNRVLYIENTGVRAPRLRDSRRVAHRFWNWLRSLLNGGVREIEANLFVCSPLALPPFAGSWRRFLNQKWFLPLIARTVRKLNLSDPLLWTYLPTNTALDLVTLLGTPASVMVYYCADNFSQLTSRTAELGDSERGILKAADVVFATCAELAENCRKWNGNVHIFPAGVNLEAFPLHNDASRAYSKNTNGNAVEAIRHLSRPIIGYIGGVHDHIDFRLLIDLARSRPTWSLVFVGTLQTSVGDLSNLANVHFMGQQPHDSLAAYLHEFDVCIVPYVTSAYTATVVPTKINEYLAAGKAVVSTNLPAVVELNRQYDVLQTSSPRSADFLSAIERTLMMPENGDIKAQRRRVAEQSDWGLRLEQMSQLIEIELRRKENAAVSHEVSQQRLASKRASSA